jgi:hypothetical protein
MLDICYKKTGRRRIGGVKKIGLSMRGKKRGRNEKA